MKSNSTFSNKYLVLFLLFFAPLAAQADASVTARDWCNWFGKRYVADTKGKICWAFNKETATDKSCSGAESWLEFYPCSTTNSFRKGEGVPYTAFNSGNAFITVLGLARAAIDGNRIYLESWGGYGSFGINGSCSDWDYICMGNSMDNLIFPATAPALASNKPNDSFRKVRVLAGERSFDPLSRIMTIRNFQATLRNQPHDKENEFSALYLSLIRSANDKQDSIIRHDENAYRSHVLTEARVLLNNGRLKLDGALRKATVTTKDSVGIQIAYISMPEVRLQVPPGVDLDSVTLSVGSDVGNLQSGISSRYLPGQYSTVYEVAPSSTSKELLEFSAYPNPVARGPVTVEVMIEQSQQVVLGVYDQVGKLVLPVYSGLLEGRTRRSFPINLDKLASGTYLLRLTRGDGSLTRRVVVR